MKVLALFFYLFISFYSFSQNEIHYLNPPAIKTDKYDIFYKNIVAEKDYCKLKVIIRNTSDHNFLVYKVDKTGFFYKEYGTYYPLRQATTIIAPGETKTDVAKVSKDIDYRIDKFSILNKGLMTGSISEVFELPEFRIEKGKESNSDVSGITIKCLKLKSEKGELSAKLNFSFEGENNRLVIIHPKKIKLFDENNNEINCDINKEDDIYLMSKDDVKIKISAESTEKIFRIQTKEAFSNVKLHKIALNKTDVKSTSYKPEAENNTTALNNNTTSNTTTTRNTTISVNTGNNSTYNSTYSSSSTYNSTHKSNSSSSNEPSDNTKHISNNNSVNNSTFSNSINSQNPPSRCNTFYGPKNGQIKIKIYNETQLCFKLEVDYKKIINVFSSDAEFYYEYGRANLKFIFENGDIVEDKKFFTENCLELGFLLKKDKKGKYKIKSLHSKTVFTEQAKQEIKKEREEFFAKHNNKNTSNNNSSGSNTSNNNSSSSNSSFNSNSSNNNVSKGCYGSPSIGSTTVKLKITWKGKPAAGYDIQIRYLNEILGNNMIEDNGTVKIRTNSLSSPKMDVYGCNGHSKWSVTGDWVVLDNSNYFHLKLDEVAAFMAEMMGMSVDQIGKSWGF